RGNSRIAQVFERVAARTVVHVQRGAALQRRLIAEIGSRLLQGTAFGSHGRDRDQQAGGDGDEPAGDVAKLAHWHGLGLSHASSPVPAPAWPCRTWSTAAS